MAARRQDLANRLAGQPTEVRVMTADDLSAVVTIEKRAYRYPWSLSVFADCLSAGYHARVLAVASRIYGYGVLSVGAGEGHVLNVAVEPAAQGLGFGRTLVQALVDLARRQRVDTLFLEVRPSNVAAVALYDQLGFQEVGRRKGYYPARFGREDALILARTLQSPWPID